MREFGQFTLVRRIAVGGMAEVHLARTKGVGGYEKYVALKMIHPNFAEDEQFIAMLIDEARIAIALTHTNIAHTIDLGRFGDTYYITMEFVDGADLYKVLRTASEKDDYLPFDCIAAIAKGVAAGLDYAHRKRDLAGNPLHIVHRDVSPQNVLVSYAGEVKLVDFGIAKAALKEQQTAAGVIKGKYYYMSPEQAWGDSVDYRSDIFSAGIVLYEMITGQMLYLEEHLHKLLDMVRRADIAPPSTLRSDCPAELARITMRALAKRPEDRYQSAADMAADLERFLYGIAPNFSPTKLATLLRRIVGEPEPLEGGGEVTRDGFGGTHPLTDDAVVHSPDELRDENSVLFRLADLAAKAPLGGKSASAPNASKGAGASGSASAGKMAIPAIAPRAPAATRPPGPGATAAPVVAPVASKPSAGKPSPRRREANEETRELQSYPEVAPRARVAPVPGSVAPAHGPHGPGVLNNVRSGGVAASAAAGMSAPSSGGGRTKAPSAAPPANRGPAMTGNSSGAVPSPGVARSAGQSVAPASASRGAGSASLGASRNANAGWQPAVTMASATAILPPEVRHSKEDIDELGDVDEDDRGESTVVSMPGFGDAFVDARPRAGGDVGRADTEQSQGTYDPNLTDRSHTDATFADHDEAPTLMRDPTVAPGRNPATVPSLAAARAQAAPPARPAPTTAAPPARPAPTTAAPPVRPANPSASPPRASGLPVQATPGMAQMPGAGRVLGTPAAVVPASPMAPTQLDMAPPVLGPQGYQPAAVTAAQQPTQAESMASNRPGEAAIAAVSAAPPGLGESQRFGGGATHPPQLLGSPTQYGWPAAPAVQGQAHVQATQAQTGFGPPSHGPAPGHYQGPSGYGQMPGTGGQAGPSGQYAHASATLGALSPMGYGQAGASYGQAPQLAGPGYGGGATPGQPWPQPNGPGPHPAGYAAPYGNEGYGFGYNANQANGPYGVQLPYPGASAPGFGNADYGSQENLGDDAQQYRIAGKKARGPLMVVIALLAIAVAASATYYIVKSTRSKAVARGSVRVESAPAGASVYIDGTKLGNVTPLAIDNLAAGSSHDLRIELPRYRSYSTRIDLPATGGLVPVTAIMTPITGKLRIASTPSGADVYIGGQLRNRTPCTITDVDMDGVRDLELRHKEFPPKRVRLDWTDKGELELNVALGR